MEQIKKLQTELSFHPVYETFVSINSLRNFMRYHVFAVWDFMSLLKRLQRDITCVGIPWMPSPFPADIVRLINQIVLGEESDVDKNGMAVSHFELYLKAMKEVGVSTDEISNFLKTRDLKTIPDAARDFVKHNIELASSGDLIEVAASFFYGREKLIPGMFQTIVDTLKQNKVEAPTLIYYLERHIEVDEGEHGPLALKCLDFLIDNDPDKKNKAIDAGVKALMARKKLWNNVLELI